MMYLTGSLIYITHFFLVKFFSKEVYCCSLSCSKVVFSTLLFDLIEVYAFKEEFNCYISVSAKDYSVVFSKNDNLINEPKNSLSTSGELTDLFADIHVDVFSNLS